MDERTKIQKCVPCMWSMQRTLPRESESGVCYFTEECTDFLVWAMNWSLKYIDSEFYNSYITGVFLLNLCGGMEYS